MTTPMHHPPGNGKSGKIIAVATDTDGQSGAGDILSLTVEGDGVNDVLIEWAFASMATNAAAGNTIGVRLRDGAGGTGTVYGIVEMHNGGANYEVNGSGMTKIAAFSGSKTFYLNLYAGSGTPVVGGGATYPVVMTARFA